ncbi:MAG: hypothetical protein U0Q12_01100 [Vicinamibacterales bacterium]
MVIGRLAGGIAHDFNNIVQAIRRGPRGSANDELPKIACCRTTPRIAEGEGYSAWPARQLLRWPAAGTRQGHRDRLPGCGRRRNMEELLRRVDRRASAAFDAGVRHGGSRRPTSRRSRPGARRTMLVSTSAIAMAEGGMLAISTANAELPEPADDAFSGIQPGRTCCCPVEVWRRHDAEIEPGPSSRSSRPRPGKGTGLGLSTVYGIVEAERRLHGR